MRGKRQWLTSAALSVAMIAPMGALAMSAPQDDHERHEQEERDHRIYDPVHKDYHNWDAREDAAYRRWLEEKHEAYVEYNRLDHKRQDDYWKWRHKHEDPDHDRH